MNVETILISAVVGIITSIVTAYITTHLRMREEKEKWQREFSVKYLEAKATDNSLAPKMAMQFAIGFLIYQDKETLETQKIFMPPNYRLSVGRTSECEICLNDVKLSRYHCAFETDEGSAYVIHFQAMTPTFLNEVKVEGRCKLKTGDVVKVGKTKIKFYKIEKN